MKKSEERFYNYFCDLIALPVIAVWVSVGLSQMGVKVIPEQVGYIALTFGIIDLMAYEYRNWRYKK